MRICKTIVRASASASLLVASGCDVSVHDQPRERVYVQQQPRYVEQQPQYVEQQPQYVEAQPQYVVVEQAPPELIVEVQPAPPAPDYVWIGGYWNWDNRSYHWQAGRYSRPPQPDVVWVAPRYESNAHRYTPGQWSKSNQRPRQNPPQNQKQNSNQQQNQNNGRGRQGN